MPLWMYGPGKAPPRQPRQKVNATAAVPAPEVRPKATRQSYTDYERVAVRRKHAEEPSLTQKEIIQWFEPKFNKTLRQVTVSEFLSKKYAHLDELEEGSDCRRHRGESWPDLERALAQWFIIKSQQGEHVGGDALRTQAKWFWNRLPQYRGIEEPTWSNGWLQGFKARRGIIPRPNRPRKRKNREEDEPADSTQAPQQPNHNPSQPTLHQTLQQSSQQPFPKQSQPQSHQTIEPPEPEPSALGIPTDNAEETMPHIRHLECLQAIQTLRLYEQRQKDCQTVFLHTLDGYEKVVRTRLRESLEPSQPNQPNQMETFFSWD
ncbi:hypothetical protein KC332_g4169 [Hortaea werneckii]|nr:hypothetical protein KC358_g8360 [Hortaea werneckii]KAI6849542.1 hypothetical protein KC350_g2563 [Hortaea werneckii]KAI6928332.1 hypothetical protein KC341_g11586 [Hortaea werneckii]KAI6945809.1 hypothetical protein KC348_g3546 [Hortaea werneckii]KAI6961414.1 hypothetical protein KC321_g12332 [Hortaea werneckii]